MSSFIPQCQWDNPTIIGQCPCRLQPQGIVLTNGASDGQVEFTKNGLYSRVRISLGLDGKAAKEATAYSMQNAIHISKFSS